MGKEIGERKRGRRGRKRGRRGREKGREDGGKEKDRFFLFSTLHAVCAIHMYSNVHTYTYMKYQHHLNHL